MEEQEAGTGPGHDQWTLADPVAERCNLPGPVTGARQ